MKNRLLNLDLREESGRFLKRFGCWQRGSGRNPRSELRSLRKVYQQFSDSRPLCVYHNLVRQGPLVFQ